MGEGKIGIGKGKVERERGKDKVSPALVAENIPFQ